MNQFNFKILFGFCLISFILYNRLFRLRQDKLLNTSVEIFQFLCYCLIPCVMFLLCITNIIIFLIAIDYYKKNHAENKYAEIFHRIARPFRVIFNYINSSLETLDAYIKNSTPRYSEEQNYTHFLSEKLAQILKKKSKLSLILFFAIIITSQTIVVISFSIDIFVFQKIHYFYKVLWILIFPMIISYLIYTLRTFHTVNLIELSNIIDIRIVKNNELSLGIDLNKVKFVAFDHFYFLRRGEFLNESTCIHSIKKSFLEEQKDLDINATLNCCITELHKFLDTRNYVDDYDCYKNKYLSFFNIWKYLLYTISWSYLIYLTFCL